MKVRIIKNKRDAEILTGAGVLADEFTNHLNKFFDDLQADLDDMEPETYTVEDCGYIVILEAGDNVRDLSNVGLNQEDEGILGCIPEWFETVELDGIRYYRFLVLYNDSFGVIFYSAIGSQDAEVEQWLEQKLNSN